MNTVPLSQASWKNLHHSCSVLKSGLNLKNIAVFLKKKQQMFSNIWVSITNMTEKTPSKLLKNFHRKQY